MRFAICKCVLTIQQLQEGMRDYARIHSELERQLCFANRAPSSQTQYSAEATVDRIDDCVSA
jgi:hypothetical protein